MTLEKAFDEIIKQVPLYCNTSGFNFYVSHLYNGELANYKGYNVIYSDDIEDVDLVYFGNFYEHK